MDLALVLSNVILGIIVLFNLILTLALVRRVNSIQDGANAERINELDLFETSLPVGTTAPPFEAESVGGASVSLSDFAGRELALVFMSPGCGPCVSELPNWEELSHKAASSRTALVMVSIASREETEELVREFKLTLPTLIAPRGVNPLADDYKVLRTPSYYLINEEGRISHVGIPNTKWDRWKSLAKLWMGEAPSPSRP